VSELIRYRLDKASESAMECIEGQLDEIQSLITKNEALQESYDQKIRYIEAQVDELDELKAERDDAWKLLNYLGISPYDGSPEAEVIVAMHIQGLQRELEVRGVENEKLHEALVNTIKQWEYLPTGEHSLRTIERWLEEQMASAMRGNRQVLAEKEVCEHGEGLTDYCLPCGRVNGGG